MYAFYFDVRRVDGATIGAAFRLAGPAVASNPNDRFVLWAGNRILVITNLGPRRGRRHLITNDVLR